MHQPLALNKVLLFTLNNRAGPCFGEGWGKSIMGDGVHDNILYFIINNHFKAQSYIVFCLVLTLSLCMSIGFIPIL